LQNFNNLRAERQENYDKRKKNPPSYLSKWPKWIFYGFRILLNCTYEGYTYCYMSITNISILQALPFRIYYLIILHIVISLRSFCYVDFFKKTWGAMLRNYFCSLGIFLGNLQDLTSMSTHFQWNFHPP
jgi:hypothetical protein